EAGCHHLARGVNGGRRLGAAEVADLADAAVGDAHVGASGGRPRAVDDVAAADDQIEHEPTMARTTACGSGPGSASSCTPSGTRPATSCRRRSTWTAPGRRRPDRDTSTAPSLR